MMYAVGSQLSCKKESSKSIWNFQRYDYFLSQVTFSFVADESRAEICILSAFNMVTFGF